MRSTAVLALGVVCSASKKPLYEHNPQSGQSRISSFTVEDSLDPFFDGTWVDTYQDRNGYPVFGLKNPYKGEFGAYGTDEFKAYLYPHQFPDTSLHYIFDDDLLYSDGIYGGMPIHSCDEMPNVRHNGPEMWGGNVGMSSNTHVFNFNPSVVFTPVGTTMAAVKARQSAECPEIAPNKWPKPTVPRTEPPTAPPTEPPTAPPTMPPTELPTAPPTDSPTKAATAPTTQQPSKSPTTPPTEAATAPITQQPSKSPTTLPTARPTFQQLEFQKLNLGASVSTPAPTPGKKKSTGLGAGQIVAIAVASIVGCVFFAGMFVRPKREEQEEPTIEMGGQ